MARDTGRIPRFITKVVGAAAGVFYQVDRHGPLLPEDGPVLVTANHPNSLLDPLLVFRSSGRTTRPLAKAPLFEQLLLGTVLRALGGIPVYRRQDNPDVMHKNDEMFKAAVDALTDGGAIQIYPEGKSHSEPGLAEFRTGAARIAIAAESAKDWRLGLSVVPVGITYLRKERARTPVVVRFGEPFGFVDLKRAHESDPAEAVRILTDRIEAGIRKQTLNFVHPDDKTLVDVAERLYVRQSGWVPWRAREGLGTRFPRLQRFAEGLEWIRREAPEEHETLRRKVDRYHALHTFVGAGEGEVPPRYGLMPVARYIAGRGTLLVLGLPVALLGGLLWGVLPLAAKAMVSVVKPEFEATATYKLVGLMLGGVGFWLLWATLAWMWGGPWIAVGVAVLSPAVGYLAIQWLELLDQVREDVTLFLRLQGRPDVRERFARQRTELIAAFERVEERLLSQGRADNVSASPGG